MQGEQKWSHIGIFENWHEGKNIHKQITWMIKTIFVLISHDDIQKYSANFNKKKLAKLYSAIALHQRIVFNRVQWGTRTILSYIYMPTGCSNG